MRSLLDIKEQIKFSVIHLLHILKINEEYEELDDRKIILIVSQTKSGLLDHVCIILTVDHVASTSVFSGHLGDQFRGMGAQGWFKRFWDLRRQLK
jgi:hypothetical protein